MKAYVLSLPRDRERFAMFERELSAALPGCTFEIPEMYDVTGYTGKDLSRVYDREKTLAVNRREIGRREIGNILSQQFVYERVIAEGRPYGLIFEDDVMLSRRLQGALPFIEAWFAQRISKPVVLLLSQPSTYRFWQSRPLGDGLHRVCPVLAASGNYAYMLNPAAARRLLAFNRPICHHPDAWSTYNKKSVVRVYAILPFLAGNHDFDRKKSNLSQERHDMWHQANARMGQTSRLERSACLARHVLTQVHYLATGVTRIKERTNTGL